MKAILRSINNFSCKLKQNNNLKYDISPKIRSNKFKSISGNGNVVIDDAIKRNLKDYRVYGNTYQNSTSGKNLISLIPRTSFGITSFYDKQTGKISFSGTTTQQWIGIENKHAVSIPAGTYTLSLKETKTFRITVRCYTDDTNYEEISISANSKSSTKTFSNNVIALQIWVNLVNNIAYNEEFYLQLEEGSTSTDFEPYTNGPSPNPDYPQEIISCGDKTKNLFDVTKPYTNENLSAAGVTLTFNDDGTITANGTNNASYKYIRFDISLEAGTYYFSGCPIGGSNNGYSIIAQTGSGSSSQIFDTGEGATFTLTEKKTIQFFPVRVGSSTVTFNNMVFKPIIAKVPVMYANYEPYGYKIPVNVRSENLFDKDNFTNGYIDSSGVYHADGTWKVNALSDYIKIDNNTDYIFSAKSSIYNISFALYDSNKTFIKRVNAYNTDSNKINSGTSSYCRVSCNISQQTNITSELIEQYEIQLIKSSSKPSKYIPYYNETTNIYLDEPLRKIGTYTDLLDFKNNRIIRQLGEIILDGSENWSKYYYAFQLTINNASKTPNNLSTHFINIISARWISSDEINRGKFTLNNQAHILKVMPLIDMTIEEFKLWLSSNNVTVDYVLKTPAEEDIELPNINLIEGKNIITIDTEVQGVFETEYYSKEIIDISNYKYNLRKVED